MRRNPDSRRLRLMEQTAQRVTTTAADLAATGPNQLANVNVGANDANTGLWTPCGLLDFTEFEEGFGLG